MEFHIKPDYSTDSGQPVRTVFTGYGNYETERL